MKEQDNTLKEQYGSQNMSNPTMKTQEKVLDIIKKSEHISINEIANQSGLNFYQVKASINYLKRLGVVSLIVSSNNMTLVQLNKGVQNVATA